MAMFGDVGTLVACVAVGAAGLMMTKRFAKPTHGDMNLLGFLVAGGLSLLLIVGGVVQFFDPPRPPAPVHVAPVVVHGASPYSAAPSAPSPYAPPAKP